MELYYRTHYLSFKYICVRSSGCLKKNIFYWWPISVYSHLVKDSMYHSHALLQQHNTGTRSSDLIWSAFPRNGVATIFMSNKCLFDILLDIFWEVCSRARSFTWEHQVAWYNSNGISLYSNNFWNQRYIKLTYLASLWNYWQPVVYLVDNWCSCPKGVCVTPETFRIEIHWKTPQVASPTMSNYQRWDHDQFKPVSLANRPPG